MARMIPIIDARGNTTEQIVNDTGVTFVPPDNNEVSPSVTQRVEYDSDGEDSSITTVCGETENRQEEQAKPDLTVEAIVTDDELQALKAIRQSRVQVTCPIHTGEVYIKRLTIEDNNKLNEIEIDGERSPAFSVQIQLRAP